MLISPDSWDFLPFSLFSFNQLLWLFLSPFLPLAQPRYWRVHLRAVFTEKHFPSCEENLFFLWGTQCRRVITYCKSINSAERVTASKEVYVSFMPFRLWTWYLNIKLYFVVETWRQVSRTQNMQNLGGRIKSWTFSSTMLNIIRGLWSPILHFSVWPVNLFAFNLNVD